MHDMIFNSLTISVLVILAVFTFIGWKKGFFRMVLSLFSLIISLVLVWILYPHIYSVLGQFRPLQEAVYGKVNEFMVEEIPGLFSDLMDTAGTAAQNDVIETLPIPGLIRDNLIQHNTATAYEALGVESFGQYLTATITSLIIQGISILLTLLAAFILLHLLMVVTDLVSRLPVLHSLNKTAGTLVGFITGYLVVQILFLVITTSSGTSWGMNLMKQINESDILTFLYNSNVMVKMMFSQLTNSFQG